MGMLAAVLVFVALSAWFVAWHVRSRPATLQPKGRPCPRCEAVVADGMRACPACRAPLQAFELVRAPVAATLTPGASAAAAPLHAMVRADVCVGCATCVPACPETGALQIIDHIAHVDRDRCKAHGSCVEACPVGAIFMGNGEAVQMLEAPDLSVGFESLSAPGLHVVGELGGRGLIKNAVNEGKLAVEALAKSLRESRHLPQPDVLDVVVVGAGPAGLSAGLEALAQGLRFVVLEQGSFAETIMRYPRQKILFSESVRIPLYGDLWVADSSKESLLRLWQSILDSTGLTVRTHSRVDEIVRERDLWRIRCGSETFRSRRVVLAMGRRGTPRRLAVPGEDLTHVVYDILEMEAYAHQRVLVVGGGDSAAESALGLANQPGTHVTLAHRSSTLLRVQPRLLAKLEVAAAAGQLSILSSAHVRAIEPQRVHLDHAGQPLAVPADAVIVRIGGASAAPFLEALGVRLVKKELRLDGSGSVVAG
jgi:thioredoxin reductase/Pyruvate/2-oxoacid:ferredoxin oxidoreductase delta subunit